MIEVSVMEYIKKIWRSAPVIISWTILCVIALFFVKGVLKTPVYQADTQIYILSRLADADYGRLDISDLQVSSQIANDSLPILKSRQVREKVAAYANEEISADEKLTVNDLTNMVTVSKEDDSLIINISVQTSDPYLSCDLANLYREIAVEELIEKFNASGVQTMKEAIIPTLPYGRSDRFYMIVGACLGVISSLAIIFVHHVLYSSKIKPEDIKEI